MEHLKCFKKLIRFQRIPYEMRSLSVGDYLWIMRMYDGTEMVLDTIVERKTLDDLWSSIVQKRLSLPVIPENEFSGENFLLRLYRL